AVSKHPGLAHVNSTPSIVVPTTLTVPNVGMSSAKDCTAMNVAKSTTAINSPPLPRAISNPFHESPLKSKQRDSKNQPRE
ncbi:MAG TPA: hypothetical protein VFK18_05910, partial [Luteimonas sp.]|nr:hypothetical protein [Luteimonas sp.]